MSTLVTEALHPFLRPSRNTESSSYSDAPTPESESWSPGPAIDSGSALSISAEGTVCNVTPSAGGAEPHIDVSLALVMSDSEKRACDDIPGALNIEAVPQLSPQK